MSIEEIVNVLERLEDGAEACAIAPREPETERKYHEHSAQALREAISLLRTHPDAQPNEPLTLEELREMDGEPVWIDRGQGYGGRWALVQVWAKSTNIIYLILSNGAVLLLKVEIDNGAEIYRRPPKED